VRGVRFPSAEWAAAVVAALGRQPDLGKALQGLPDDLALVVESDPPCWRSELAVWGRQERGRIAEWRVLDDADEILEIEPAYVLRAPYRIWKALLRGDDAVQAVLSGRIKLRGNLEQLVRRASYRYVLEAAVREVVTEFADEVEGPRT
jgi:hypothetical protein